MTHRLNFLTAFQAIRRSYTIQLTLWVSGFVLALNQAVKRNSKRFEGDEFMFQLTKQEWELFTKNGVMPPVEDNKNNSFSDDYNLRSQIATSRFSNKWGGNRRPPTGCYLS